MDKGMIIRYNLHMKIAVLSDIHANYHALLACIEFMLTKEIDCFVFLGDYLTDLAFPLKTVEILQDLAKHYKCYFIRGNREDYLLDNRKCPNFRISSKSGSLYYTYRYLNDDVLDWFETMPIYQKVELTPDITFEIAHANINDNRDLFFKNDVLERELFKDMQTDCLMIGHSHEQYIIKQSNKLIVNPGTVGLSQFGHRQAECAIVEYLDGNWDAELYRIPYDNQKVIEEQFIDDFKDCAKAWMLASCYSVLTGINYHLKLHSWVTTKVKETNCDIYDEMIWDDAIRHFGMSDNLEDLLKDVYNR